MSQKKKHHDKQRDSDQGASPATKVDRSVQGKNNQAVTDSKQDSKIDRLEDRIKRGEKWMLALTAAMVVTGILQWQLGVRQAQDAKAATRMDQRAWVSVKNQSIPPIANRPFCPVLQAGNSGRTPARDLTLRWAITINPREDPVPDFNRPLQSDDEQFRNILYTDQTVSFSCGETPPSLYNPVSREFMDLLKRGDRLLHVWGDMRYKDVFDKTHWVKFCWRYAPDTNNWAACQQYNSIDL